MKLGVWGKGRVVLEETGLFFDFNQFIEKLELVDLPMMGRRFMWSNSGVKGKWSRMDFYFVLCEWRGIFRISVQSC